MTSGQMLIVWRTAILGVAIMTIKGSVLVTASFGAGAASSAFLPIKPGSYVLAGVPCKGFAFTALSSDDGKKFSYTNASRCRSAIRSHVGNTYHLRRTCSALGDGTPTAPTVMEANYAMQSFSSVTICRGPNTPILSYRRCPRHGRGKAGDRRAGKLVRAAARTATYEDFDPLITALYFSDHCERLIKRPAS